MTPPSAKRAGVFLATALLGLSHHAQAFVPPRAFAVSAGSVSSAHEMLPSSSLLGADIGGGATLSSAILVSDGMMPAADMDPSGSLAGLRTFFVVVGAVVVGFVLLATLTAAFVVPQATKSLEEDTRRLRPGLWEEFEARLAEGETMVSRPDLLQELGGIMKPEIIAEYETTANEKIPNPKNPFQSSGTTDAKSGGNSVDTDDRWKD